jgi:hypothetical protein
MLISEGEKIHVIARRNFDNDVRRHFVGEVRSVGAAAMRVEGYTFIFDQVNNYYIRQPDKRIRIIALADSGNIITVIPRDINLDALIYRHTQDNRVVMTDGSDYCLDINEFGPNR